MAEDALFEFKFSVDKSGKTVVDDAAADLAMDRLNIEIGRYMSMKDEEPAERGEPAWDDNVPPDFSDDFDFLL